MSNTLLHAKAEFRSALWILALLSLGTNILVLVTPLYMLQIYDRVLGSGSVETLAFLSLIALAAVITMGGLESIRAIISHRIGSKLDVRLSQDIIQASMESPEATNGNIQPLRDLASVRNFIASPALSALMDLPFAPLFLIVLLMLQPVLAGLTFIGIIVLAALAVINQRATDKFGTKSAQSSLEALSAAQTYVRNAEVITSLGMRQNAINRWGNLHGQSLRSLDDVGKLSGIFMGVSRTARILLQMSVLGLGGLLALNGYMTAGMIFAASLISGRALQPIDQVIGNWRNITHSLSAWQRLTQTLDKNTNANSSMQLPAIRGQIELENATYFHVSSNGTRDVEPLLRRISFSLEAGSSLAVIGPSGAGKTTLLRMMIGAIPASQGVLRYDGSDIKQFDMDLLGRQIGYLPQDIELLPGTVAQNIARLDENPNFEDVIKAAKMANAHDLIQHLSEGYDTVLGPSGVMLSGGQRQRIGLARAFYGNPKILLLDEPNANLDAEGENALGKALETAKSLAISIVIVTQRMSALRHVDRILHLRDGMVERLEQRDEFIARLTDNRKKQSVKLQHNNDMPVQREAAR